MNTNRIAALAAYACGNVSEAGMFAAAVASVLDQMAWPEYGQEAYPSLDKNTWEVETASPFSMSVMEHHVVLWDAGGNPRIIQRTAEMTPQELAIEFCSFATDRLTD